VVGARDAHAGAAREQADRQQIKRSVQLHFAVPDTDWMYAGSSAFKHWNVS
jgi:hypothetical protein